MQPVQNMVLHYSVDKLFFSVLHVLLCVAGIQQYLFENNRIDNIFTDFYYDRFTECLNDILTTYQVSLNSQGSFCTRRSCVLLGPKH